MATSSEDIAPPVNQQEVEVRVGNHAAMQRLLNDGDATALQHMETALRISLLKIDTRVSTLHQATLKMDARLGQLEKMKPLPDAALAQPLHENTAMEERLAALVTTKVAEMKERLAALETMVAESAERQQLAATEQQLANPHSRHAMQAFNGSHNNSLVQEDSSGASGAADMEAHSARGVGNGGCDVGACDEDTSRSNAAGQHKTPSKLSLHGEVFEASAKRGKLYILKESMWDYAMLMRTTSQVSWLSTIYQLCLLLSNCFLQILFVVVCYMNFTSPDVTHAHVQSAVFFRERFSHDQKFTELQSLNSLGHRLCRYGLLGEKIKLESAANQANLLDDIEGYLSEYGTTWEQLFNGQAVCMIALTCWCASVVAELQTCTDFICAFVRFPRGAKTEFTVNDEGVTFNCISWFRFAWTLFFFGLRVCIAISLLLIGCTWLAGTITVRDLLLNAVALEFIMNLDDTLFRAFGADCAKTLVENFAPISMGRPLSFGVGKYGGVEYRTAFLALCVPAVVFAYLTILTSSMSDDMRGVVDALCHPPLDFTWGSDAFHFVQLTGTPHADVYGMLATKAVQEVLHGRSATFSDVPSDSRLYSQDPAQWRMTVVAATGLSKSQLPDLYNPTCTDLSPLARPGLAEQVMVLLGSRHCTWMKAKTDYCNDLASDQGVLMRTVCPITCGCDQPFSSLPVDSNNYGCPSSCKATEAFRSARAVASCRDTDGETLKMSVYWSAMVQFMKRFDAKLGRELEDRGCNFRVARGTGVQLCQGIHHSGMKSIALMCPEACACGDRDSDMCAYGPSSLWCTCLNDFKKMGGGSSLSELCTGMYCALQEWNRDNAAELTKGEHKVGMEYAVYLRPCKIQSICSSAGTICGEEIDVCSNVTGGEISKYPCACGTSSRSREVCSASFGILNGKQSGQLCNAFSDWDGACKDRVCTSVDGSAFSTFYPCRCNTISCVAGQRCNANSNGGVCEANYYRKSSNMLNSTIPRGGICTCSDGKAYAVGDNGDNCGSLACENGVPGTCSDMVSGTAGKGMIVTCAAAMCAGNADANCPEVLNVLLTSLTADVAAGSHSVQVLNTSGMSAGSSITISDGLNSETKAIQSVLKQLHGHGRRLQAGGTVTVTSSFQYAYSAGAGVTFEVGVCSDTLGRPSTVYPCKCGKSKAAVTQCTADQQCLASNDTDGVCKDYCMSGYKWIGDGQLDYCETADGTLLSCKTTEASAFACQQRCARIFGCVHFSFFHRGGCSLAGHDASIQAATTGVTSGSLQCTQPNPSGYWRLENDSFTFVRAVIQDSADMWADMLLADLTSGRSYQVSNLTKSSFRIEKTYKGGRAKYSSDSIAGSISMPNGAVYVRTRGDIVSLAIGGRKFCNSNTRKCKKCQGHCDSDDDCADGLLCVVRRAREPVAGCIGNGRGDVKATNYCSPATQCPTTRSPTILGCADGSECDAKCTASTCSNWDCCGVGKLAFCPKGWIACHAEAANRVDMLCNISCKHDGGNKQCEAIACSNIVGGTSLAYPCRCGISSNAPMQCESGSLCFATNDMDGICQTTTTTTLWCDWTLTNMAKFRQIAIGTVWSKDACLQKVHAKGTCELATIATSVSESSPQICYCDQGFDRTSHPSSSIMSCWLDTLEQSYVEMVTTSTCGDAQAGSTTVLLCDVSLLFTGMILKFPDSKHSQIATIVSISMKTSKAQNWTVAGDVTVNRALDFSYMSGTSVMIKPNKTAACPWIYGVVTSVDDQVECQDETLVQNESCVKGRHGQPFKCSPNKPMLCGSSACKLDIDYGYCCQSNCTTSGHDAQCPLEIMGCMDPSAINYNANATIDAHNCIASPPEAHRPTTKMIMELSLAHIPILNTSKFKEEQAHATGVNPEDIAIQSVQYNVTVTYAFSANVDMGVAQKAIASALGVSADNVTVVHDCASHDLKAARTTAAPRTATMAARTTASARRAVMAARTTAAPRTATMAAMRAVMAARTTAAPRTATMAAGTTAAPRTTTMVSRMSFQKLGHGGCRRQDGSVTGSDGNYGTLEQCIAQASAGGFHAFAHSPQMNGCHLYWNGPYTTVAKTSYKGATDWHCYVQASTEVRVTATMQVGSERAAGYLMARASSANAVSEQFASMGFIATVTVKEAPEVVVDVKTALASDSGAILEDLSSTALEQMGNNLGATALVKDVRQHPRPTTKMTVGLTFATAPSLNASKFKEEYASATGVKPQRIMIESVTYQVRVIYSFSANVSLGIVRQAIANALDVAAHNLTVARVSAHCNSTVSTSACMKVALQAGNVQSAGQLMAKAINISALSEQFASNGVNATVSLEEAPKTAIDVKTSVSSNSSAHVGAPSSTALKELGNTLGAFASVKDVKQDKLLMTLGLTFATIQAFNTSRFKVEQARATGVTPEGIVIESVSYQVKVVYSSANLSLDVARQAIAGVLGVLVDNVTVDPGTTQSVIATIPAADEHAALLLMAKTTGTTVVSKLGSWTTRGRFLKARGSCNTTGSKGMGPGIACIFPFKYAERVYNACTKDDHIVFWCSTQTDGSDNHISGHWGECSATCLQASTPAPTTALTFYAPKMIVDIETTVLSNSTTWPEEPSRAVLGQMGNSLGAIASVKYVHQVSLCPRRMTAIMTTKAHALCVPSGGGRVKYTGEVCVDGNIHWTSAQALDIRIGLSPSRCKWNWKTPYGISKAKYAGSCGVAPTVEGGSHLPTSCQVGDYLKGAASQNQCPADAFIILSIRTCQSAALAFGSTFGTQGSEKGWPSGCYQYKNGKFYLNTDLAGTGHEDATPVCKKQKTCTNLVGGLSSAYPCICGKSLNAMAQCISGHGCTATNDTDGVCQQPACFNLTVDYQGETWTLVVHGSPRDTFTAEGCSATGCSTWGYCARDCIAGGWGAGINTIKNQHGQIIGYGNCCGTTNTVLSASPCQSNVPTGYVHVPRSCVAGYNIIKYTGKLVHECAALCDAEPTCVAFEYGVAYGGIGGAYLPGDCQPQSSRYSNNCDGSEYNLDLYTKFSCPTTGSKGVGPGIACVFPFKYEGGLYNGCTKDDRTVFWCSTQTDGSVNHIKGHWGECSATCPQADASLPEIKLVGQVCNQSSTGFGGVCSRAFDGIAKSDFASNSCTHTDHGDNPWWKVELPSRTHISTVFVTNRGDGVGFRINGFSILVDGYVCAKDLQLDEGQTKGISCGATGSEVKIELPGFAKWLSICEVEVYGQVCGRINNLSTFSSRLQMETAGWKFAWDDQYDWKPADMQFGVPSGSYWGFKYPGIGTISLMLQGSGSLTLDYGNSFGGGTTQVSLNDIAVSSASNNTLSTNITIIFKHGDVLKIEEHGEGIIVINRINFTYKSGSNSLTYLGSNPTCLSVCEGNCDNDGDCPGESKCVQRTGGLPSAVEGCSIGDSIDSARMNTNYCSNPPSPTLGDGALTGCSTVYIVNPSPGVCPEGEELTESACKDLHGKLVGGKTVAYQYADEWGEPETCGCYFDQHASNQVYFNTCSNGPQSAGPGEIAICCKKAPTAAPTPAQAPAPTPVWSTMQACFTRGKGLLGYPMNKIPNIPSAASCQLECQGVAGCKYWVWRSDNNECRLKSEKGEEWSDRPGLYPTYGPRVCQCSWSSPHNGTVNTVLCTDGTYVDDGRCVAGGHGQRTKCPSNLPNMCAEKMCGGNQDYCCELNCDNFGGPRPCDAELAAPASTTVAAPTTTTAEPTAPASTTVAAPSTTTAEPTAPGSTTAAALTTNDTGADRTCFNESCSSDHNTSGTKVNHN